MADKDKKPDDDGKDKGKPFTFFVNGTKYQTEERTLTGAQIKAFVPNWNPDHELVLEGHGNDPDRPIPDSESVPLDKDKAPPRFSAVPKANYG